MSLFEGFLFSRLHLIGSKPEGPSYFLQQWDYGELLVKKKSTLWQEDPALQPFLGRKVDIKGNLGPLGIEYDSIKKHIMTEESRGAAIKRLIINVKPEKKILYVNQTLPQDPQKIQSFKFSLLVKWPFRSIWHGLCPTSHKYDFWVWHGGKCLWHWAEGRVFAPVNTPVVISGGDFIEFPEVWTFSPYDIKSEGTYLVVGLYIASGQIATAPFEVKLVSK